MHGYESRTLSLLIQNLKSRSIYLTGRDNIYAISIDFIRNRWGLPGGLAVIRHLTNGRYYMAHNLILELLISFGVLGTVVITISVILHFRKMKKLVDKDVYDFSSMLAIFYILYSFTGQSLFNSTIAILLIAIMYFYKRGNLNKS